MIQLDRFSNDWLNDKDVLLFLIKKEKKKKTRRSRHRLILFCFDLVSLHSSTRTTNDSLISLVPSMEIKRQQLSRIAFNKERVTWISSISIKHQTSRHLLLHPRMVKSINGSKSKKNIDRRQTVSMSVYMSICWLWMNRKEKWIHRKENMHDFSS